MPVAPFTPINRRGFPKAIVVPPKQVKSLDCGYYDYRSNGPLLAVAWKDHQMVYFVSAAHVATIGSGTVTTFQCGPSGEKLEIPFHEEGCCHLVPYWI